MRLDDLTRDEFAEIVKRGPVVILPIGGTEAHGPHLPLSTDSIQPEAIADMVAEQIDGLVAPPLRYAYHSSTRNMPGTITLSFKTTVGIVRDILLSLVANGITRVVVISGHAGSSHMAALRIACAEVVRRTNAQVMLLTDYDLARGFPVDQKGDGHGGMIETARMLALYPERVKKNDKVGKYVDLKFMIVRDSERAFPDGYVGDPSKATAEMGRKINSYIADRLVDLIKENFEGNR